MKKTWMRALVVALCLALVLPLSGCGAKKGGKTVTFQQWWEPECPEGYLQSICDRFYDETGITVELISEPYADTKTTIVAGASNGTVADVVGVSGSWLYEFVDNGILTDMDALIEKTEYDKTNFADMWKLSGTTYAVPVVTFAYPMFVNLDILDACGVKELPKTWSEFEECCRVITEKGYNAYAYDFDPASPSGCTNVLFNFIWASGATTKDDETGYAIRGNKAMGEACEYLKKLYDKGYIYPGAATMKEADMTSLFGSGETAFCSCSITMIGMYEKDSPDLNFTVMPIPVKDGYTGTQYADYACWGIGVTENSENKEDAMRFVEYLLSGEINGELAATKGCFPGGAKAEPDYSDASEIFKTAFSIWQDQTPIAEFNGAKDASTLQGGLLEEYMRYLYGECTTQELLSRMQDVVDEVYGT